MIFFTNLNDDLNEYIHMHLAAIKIQNRTRKWFMSHYHRKEWPKLRFLLVENIGSDNFKILQNSRLVRREWRNEINSWLFMSKTDILQLHVILNEIIQGLWK